MAKPVSFFGLNSPEDLFFYLQRSISRLETEKVKKFEDLLFSIMGLCHLREWIAPNYDHGRKASSKNESFYNEIYELEEFKIIQDLCNHTKHLKTISHSTKIEYGANISEYPLISEVKSIIDGPPTSFEVDGIRIEKILEIVLKYYENNWFAHI